MVLLGTQQRHRQPATRTRLLLAAAVVLLSLSALLQQAAAETRICLNMIAKDEADEILQALEPLVPELSGWTLCDTGSTDDTIGITERFFKQHGTPGVVANHKWKDFGANRNMCIKEGLEWSLKQAKSMGMAKGSHYCDYLLFLDADQILQRPIGYKPGAIKAMDFTGDGYHVVEKGIGVTYTNMRMVSTRVEWMWVGEVHEFVQRKDGQWTTQVNVPDVWLHHDASGGKEGKRFVRDEALLAKAVKERPTDARARFYLANTLRALDKVEEAITHYIERIRIGGWEEERFMSALNIAEMARRQWEEGKLISQQVKAAVGNWETSFIKPDAKAEKLEEKQMAAAHKKLSAAVNATLKAKKDPKQDTAVQEAGKAYDQLRNTRRMREFPWLVAAYQAAQAILPYRPEPYVHLSKLYRMDRDDLHRCFSYASAALAQGPPRKDALFLNTNQANFEVLDEMCVCAYYVEHAREQGLQHCLKLQAQLDAELALAPNNMYMKSMLDRTHKNMEWYTKKPAAAAAPAAADAAAAGSPSSASSKKEEPLAAEDDCPADSKTCASKKKKRKA